MLLAKAFRKSRFFGFDYQDKSIEGAREHAQRDEVADRVTFEVAKAKEFREKTATSWQSSIACMTWAIRSGRLGIFFNAALLVVLQVPGSRTVPGCASRRDVHPQRGHFGRI